MRLQYQLSNGNWMDCARMDGDREIDRTEEMLARCEEFNGFGADGMPCPISVATRPMVRADVLAALADGLELRNDNADWYSNVRDGDVAEAREAARRAARRPVAMRKCACGHTVPAALVMSASMGSSCADCYDRMSN